MNKLAITCTLLGGMAASVSMSLASFLRGPQSAVVAQPTTLLSTSNRDQQVQQQQQQLHQRSRCEDVDGILFVSRVIRKAGAGTMFFQSLVDSLLYAEKYNLLPYIWINDDENLPCYDPKVHGAGANITFSHLTGSVSRVISEGAMKCYTADGTRPGGPDHSHLVNNSYTLVGNGLWQSYFEPLVQQFPWDDPLCANKPMFEFERSQVMPDMHRCSEIAVRGWAFKGIPEALLPNGRPIADWLWDHRQRAAMVVNKYFQPRGWLKERIKQANPNPQRCLAVHIRLTDKGSGRDKKGLNYYKPFIEAYAKASDGVSPIYIATDDGTVLDTIQREWPAEVSSRIISQHGVFRSEEENVPTFLFLYDDKHRSNTEALVEIYAMARCSYFVHGYSGMAEAVVYLNPALHTRSLNIDDPERPTRKAFRQMVENVERSRAPI